MNLFNFLGHAGHGHEESFFHWFTSMDHILVMVAAAAVVVGASVVLRRKLKAQKQEH